MKTKEIYIMVEYGGEWEDKWERILNAYDNRQDAEEARLKHCNRLNHSEEYTADYADIKAVKMICHKDNLIKRENEKEMEVTTISVYLDTQDIFTVHNAKKYSCSDGFLKIEYEEVYKKSIYFNLDHIIRYNVESLGSGTND